MIFHCGDLDQKISDGHLVRREDSAEGNSSMREGGRLLKEGGRVGAMLGRNSGGNWSSEGKRSSEGNWSSEGKRSSGWNLWAKWNSSAPMEIPCIDGRS